MDLKGRNFLTLKDFTPEEIGYFLQLSKELKEKKKNGIQFGLASGSQQRKVHSTHMTVMYIDLEQD